MRATLLNAQGQVENIVLVGEGYAPPEGLTLGPSDGQIGWTWNGSDWLKPELPPPPPLTADDVRAEAQRRIIALFGVDNLTNCMIKQHNMQMRAISLTNKRARGEELSDAEKAEEIAYHAMEAKILSIRAASNKIDPAKVDDHTKDEYWKV